jgi:hypothetical protein
MPYPIKRTPYSPDRIAGTVIEALIIDSVSPVESVESPLVLPGAAVGEPGVERVVVA